MSRRTEQVSSLLCAEINQILLKDFEAPLGTLISVSQVEVSPDLKNATAYVSIIPSNHIGSGLEKIKRFGPHVQKIIGGQLKMRSTPKITWQLDERDLKYSAIDEALNS